MTEALIKFTGGLVGVAVIIGSGVLTSFLWANALQDLWLWFVVSIFRVPQLPFWNAMGLMLIVNCLTYHLAHDKYGEEDAHWFAQGIGRVAASTAGALILWGLGYLYASWGGLL